MACDFSWTPRGRGWLRVSLWGVLALVLLPCASANPEELDGEPAFKDPAATLIDGIKKAARAGKIGKVDFAGWGNKKVLNEGYKLDHSAPPTPLPPAPPPPKTGGFFSSWGGVKQAPEKRGRVGTTVKKGKGGGADLLKDLTATGKEKGGFGSAPPEKITGKVPPKEEKKAVPEVQEKKKAVPEVHEKKKVVPEDAGKARLERLEKRRREYQAHERKERQEALAKKQKVLSAASTAADAVLSRSQAAASKLAQKKLRELTSPPAKQTAPTANGSNVQKTAPKPSTAQRRALALERLKARKLVEDMRRLMHDESGGGPAGGGAAGDEKGGKLKYSLGAIEEVSKMVAAMRRQAAAGAAHPTASAVQQTFSSSPPSSSAPSSSSPSAAASIDDDPAPALPAFLSGAPDDTVPSAAPPASRETRGWLPIPGFKKEKKWLIDRTPEGVSHTKPAPAGVDPVKAAKSVPSLIQDIFDE